MGSASRLVFAGVVALVWGCGDGDGDADADLKATLDGRAFNSETLEGRTLVDRSFVRLAFDGGELSAYAGCNYVFASFTIERGTLVVDGFATTLLLCAPDRHEQDAWLMSFLGARPRLELVEPRLISSTTDVLMTLIDEEVAPPVDLLTDRHWSGSAFSDGAGTGFSPVYAEASVLFASDGTVTMNTSCQHGTASYLVSGESISFTDLGYDGAACPDIDHQQVSDQFMLVLDGSPVTFEVDPVSLVLHNGSNTQFFTAE